MSEVRTASTPPYAAPAAACAADLLSTLAENGAAMNLTDLARSVNRTKSLVYRVMSELEKAELVERLESGRYKLGMTALLLGGAYVSSAFFRDFVDRELRRLATEIGETAYLATLEGNSIRIRAGHEGKNAVAMASLMGKVIPANCAASGKALLAHLPTRAVRRLFGGGMRGLTSRSIVDVDVLLQELESIRSMGFATDEGETHPSLAGLACTIHGRATAGGPLALRVPDLIMASGDDFLAIGMSLSIERLEDRHELVEALKESASRVERETALLVAFGTSANL